MKTVGVKAAAYCLNFAPELALHHGGTPSQERKAKPDSEFLRELPKHAQTYEQAIAYAPNKTYIGAMSVEELAAAPAPWLENLGAPERYGNAFLLRVLVCDFDGNKVAEAVSAPATPRPKPATAGRVGIAMGLEDFDTE